jgi:uridine kinase
VIVMESEGASHKPIVIGVCGGEGSGRSAIVNLLCEYVGRSRVIVLHSEHFRREECSIRTLRGPAEHIEHPAQFDDDKIIECVRAHALAPAVCVSVDEKGTSTALPKVVFIEGAFILAHATLRDLCDVSVFVDSPDEVRFQRSYEASLKALQLTRDEARLRWELVIRPIFEEFCLPLRGKTDIVFDGSAAGPDDMPILWGAIQGALADRKALRVGVR